MELHDLLGDAEFASRPLVPREAHREAAAFQRLARVFTEPPETLLQNLVEIAVELCEADSAGVSLEDNDDPSNPRFRWIAVAGSFQKYLNGTTPRHYSPCGTCLDSGRPQYYRLFQPYYDFLGVKAEPILDGLLIPWENDSMRGTLWAVSHRSREVFNLSDYQLMRGLADFVSLALAQQGRQKILRGEERHSASLERANEMAHAINNPLQSLTNTIYLARQGGDAALEHIENASSELERLSKIVAELLRTRVV